MSSLIRRYRTLGLAAVLVAAALAVVMATPEPGWADDRDLLVSGLKKPYLFIILDSSGSMNLRIGEDPRGDDEPTVGFGDDPDSRIYAAKEALYTVFSNRDDVHFGFATFDQDELRVVNKHWLYPVTQTVVDDLYEDPWPISVWPMADPEDDPLVIPPDGPPVDCDGDGIDDNGSTKCYAGDALVFGAAATGVPIDAAAGTCQDPLDLDTDRDRLNAFARLGADGTDDTQIWVSDAGLIYRLTFSSAGTPGDATLTVDFTAEAWDITNVWPDDCDADETDILPTGVTATADLFLDPYLNEFLMVDNPGPDADAPEGTAGHWLAEDAISTATCTNSRPFTGQGWESNYDSGTLLGDTSFDSEITNEDPYCDPDVIFERGTPTGIPDATDPNACIELRPMRPTKLSTLGRFADSGDVLPFDWDDSNKDEFLARLAPNHMLGGEPNFAVSPHLTDTLSLGADGSGNPLSLAPKISGRPPIIATGVTPLGKAMLDFRCWYTGNQAPGPSGQLQNVPKCDEISETPFFESGGWSGAACDRDPEFGCRRPFLILITDGADTCAGESPVADISDLKNKLGLQTWALNLGDPQHCSSGGQNNVLHSVTTAGNLPGGPEPCINIANKEDLLNALENIAETIAASAQAFAAAAVPTVQSNANQRIFLSSFRAVPEASTWEGHLSSFWKPLPVREEVIGPDPDDIVIVPDADDEFCEDTDARDTTPTPGDGCHLWDAGEVLANDQHDGLDPLDLLDWNKRRVFYSRQTANGN